VRDASAFVRLIIGVAVFAGVLAWEIRRILTADLPQLRAVEAAAVSVTVFLCLYATTYVTLSELDPGNFTEHLNRTASLYFAIVTFGTVGYGDVAPRTDLACIIVSSQVLGDLVFIALGLRALFGLSKLSLNRGEHGTRDDLRD
jgi:voltage-gated potassium channel